MKREDWSLLAAGNVIFHCVDANECFEPTGDHTSKVRILTQHRNGDNALTTIAGLPELMRLPKCGALMPLDFEAIVLLIKRFVNTRVTLSRDAEQVLIIQLQVNCRFCKKLSKTSVEKVQTKLCAPVGSSLKHQITHVRP